MIVDRVESIRIAGGLLRWWPTWYTEALLRQSELTVLIVSTHCYRCLC